MQNKTMFATIAILSSALFAAMLAMILAVQPAAGGGAGYDEGILQEQAHKI